MRNALKIMTLNARGINSKEPAIARIIERHKIDIAIITETHLKPGKAMPPGWNHHSARTDSGRGGVTIITRKNLPSQLAFKYGNDKIQVVIIRIAGLYIAGVYYSPSAPLDEFTAEMTDIHRICNGPTIIIGDLNAQHQSWAGYDLRKRNKKAVNRNKKAVNRGTRLRAWCNEKHWTVHAPPTPTFRRRNITSTLDLALTRGVQIERPKTLAFVEWTDHCPVIVTAQTPATATPQPATRITYARREREELQNKTQATMEQNYPRLIQRIQQAHTKAELEAAYEDFANTLLQHYRPKTRRTREAPPLYWTPELDKATRLRSKLYKRWKKTNKIIDRQIYKDQDRATKRLIKATKRESFKALGNMLAKHPNPMTLVARYSKARKKRVAKNNLTHYRNLSPAAFTAYNGNKFPVDASMPKVQPRAFQVDSAFRKEIEIALQRAPKCKAAGADELFVEAIKLTPKKSAAFLQTLWAKCGELKYIPRAWRTTIWVPIHKGKSQGVPENYRAIALLSHARKIIETALNRTIKRQIEFHVAQCGFKQHSSCEQALLRYASNAKRARYAAVLDLKGAYASIPRHRLMDIIDKRIGPNLAAMASHFLTEEICHTIGDPTTTTVRRGVAEGSPLSPTLFNLLMDTLATQILEKKTERDMIPVTLFADDTNLQTTTEPSMRTVMNTCDKWAEENQMTWAPQKSSILAKEMPRTPFKLAGRQVKICGSCNSEMVLHGTYRAYVQSSNRKDQQNGAQSTGKISPIQKADSPRPRVPRNERIQCPNNDFDSNRQSPRETGTTATGMQRPHDKGGHQRLQP